MAGRGDVDERTVLFDQRSTLKALARRFWILLLCALIGGGIGLGVSNSRTPTYDASVQLELGPSATSSVLGLDAGQDAKTAQATAVSLLQSPALQLIVRKTEPSAGPVSAQAVTDSTIVVVTGVGASPSEAVRITQTYVDAYLTFLRRRATTDLGAAQQRLQGDVDRITQALQGFDDKLALVTGSARDRLTTRQASQRAALQAALDRATTALGSVSASLASPSLGAAQATPAVSGGSPSGPSRNRDLLLGVLAGLVVGTVIVLLLQTRDKRLYDVEDVERLAGSAFLGVVPPLQGRKDQSAWVVLDLPHTPQAGAWRVAVEQLRRGPAPLHSVLVLPAGSQDAVRPAMEVAAVLTEDGRRVVLADLGGMPTSVAAEIGLPESPGARQLISQQADLGQVLRPVAVVPGLAVLTSGASRSQRDLLGASTLERVLQQVDPVCDSVVLCGPAVTDSSSAAAAARRASAVVVIVVLGRTTAPELDDALRALARLGADQIGVLVLSSASRTGRSETGRRTTAVGMEEGRREGVALASARGTPRPPAA